MVLVTAFNHGTNKGVSNKANCNYLAMLPTTVITVDGNLAKKTNLGRLTTWPSALITVHGRLTYMASCKNLATLPKHKPWPPYNMARFTNHRIWPPSLILQENDYMANCADRCTWPPYLHGQL
jgi:hypothetical protein